MQILWLHHSCGRHACARNRSHNHNFQPRGKKTSALRYLQIERRFRSWSVESRAPAWRAATGFAEKASGMNRREFTGGLAAAVLSASLRTTSAGAIVETACELSMLEGQQRFLDLRFGMCVQLNMG